MKSKSALIKYAASYGKNYLQESLAINNPKITWLTPKPLYIGLSVGTVCNFLCKQCDLPLLKTNTKKYLTEKEMKDIVSQLKSWLGPYRLVFTGAEPLVRRKEVLNVIRHCSDNDVYTVMTSNGWLISDQMAKKIVDSGLDVINISLDGAISKTHDFSRGKKGAFDQALKALTCLKKHKEKTPTIYINSIIMDQNVNQLKDLVKIAQKYEVDNIRFQALESKYMFGNAKYDPHWYKDNSLWPQDKEKLSKKIDELIALKKDGAPIKNTYSELEEFKTYYHNPLKLVKKQKHCFTGVRNFSINEYGKVLLCFGMIDVGDLRKQTPQEIWYGEKAQNLRVAIANCKRACRILPCNKRENLGQITGAFVTKIFQ